MHFPENENNIRQLEIIADWSLAVRGLPVQKIKPLE